MRSFEVTTRKCTKRKMTFGMRNTECEAFAWYQYGDTSRYLQAPVTVPRPANATVVGIVTALHVDANKDANLVCNLYVYGVTSAPSCMRYIHT